MKDERRGIGESGERRKKEQQKKERNIEEKK